MKKSLDFSRASAMYETLSGTGDIVVNRHPPPCSCASISQGDVVTGEKEIEK